MTKENLLDVLRPFGQEHLLAFWESLPPAQQESLARQIESIDFGLLRRLFERRDQLADVRQLAARAEPPPAFRLGGAGCQPARPNVSGTPAPPPAPITPAEARQAGTEALRAGRVGAILVAGGQGTRLGVTQPKGMFPVGPVSQKTLFQIHVEKIVATSRRYGVPIPLYLMTSPATHEATVAFFAEQQRFGLPEADLVMFRQGTMPAVDAENGRVLLEEPGASPPAPTATAAWWPRSRAVARWTTSSAAASGISPTSRSITLWPTSAGRSSSAITSWRAPSSPARWSASATRWSRWASSR